MIYPKNLNPHWTLFIGKEIGNCNGIEIELNWNWTEIRVGMANPIF